MWNKLQNSFSGTPNKIARILVFFLAACTAWPGTQAKAGQIKLTTVKHDVFSSNLKGFDEESRTIRLEDGGKVYSFSLSDFKFPSKIALLRTSEMKEVLASRGQPTLLYAFLAAVLSVVLLIIGYPTFLGAAFLMTGQEGKGLHFKAWLKVLGVFGLVATIRLAAPDGMLWTNALDDGIRVFRIENGAALLVALAGSVWVIKRHYRETTKLAATTLAVHGLLFLLGIAGLSILIWKSFGDLTIPADFLLTHLILKPFELI